MLSVISDFTDPDVCDRLVAAFDRNRSRGRSFGLRNEVPVSVLTDDEVWDDVMLIRQLVSAHIRVHYDAQQIIEFSVLTEMPVGSEHPAHADNVACSAGEWVPNHTPLRAYTAFVYLNDDFTGGAIRHLHLGSVVQPRKGTMVSFPCDGHHEHLVEPVTSGTRYALGMWTVPMGSSWVEQF